MFSFANKSARILQIKQTNSLRITGISISNGLLLHQKKTWSRQLITYHSLTEILGIFQNKNFKTFINKVRQSDQTSKPDSKQHWLCNLQSELELSYSPAVSESSHFTPIKPVFFYRTPLTNWGNYHVISSVSVWLV